MGRLLTQSASAQVASTLTDRYTPKFPTVSVRVPSGATACYITGVAAGGLRPSRSAAGQLHG